MDAPKPLMDSRGGFFCDEPVTSDTTIVWEPEVHELVSSVELIAFRGLSRLQASTQDLHTIISQRMYATYKEFLGLKLAHSSLRISTYLPMRMIALKWSTMATVIR